MKLKVTKLTHSGRVGKEWVTTDLTETPITGVETNRKHYESYTDHRGRTRWTTNPRKDTPSGKTRVYVSVEGENLWDDFANRTSRPHTLWAAPVKAALIAAGWPATVSLRWSQKAGCSCPCSPAFFVTGGPLGHDIWATIEADEVQADNETRNARLLGALADPTLPLEVTVDDGMVYVQ